MSSSHHICIFAFVLTGRDELTRKRRQLTILARVKYGSTLDQVNAELEKMALRIEQQKVAEAKEYRDRRLAATPFVDAWDVGRGCAFTSRDRLDSPAIAVVNQAFGRAIPLSREVATLVFGVSATKPLTLAPVALILVTVALLAAVLPAWRAARLAPVEALRRE